jgi:hypothetical protein
LSCGAILLSTSLCYPCAMVLPNVQRWWALAATWLAFSMSLTAWGAPFSSSRHGFSLTLPNDFEIVSFEDPRVALAARPRGGGFPTITVTVDAGPFKEESPDPAGRGKRILESLKGVGLLDARLTKVKPTLPGGDPQLKCFSNTRRGGGALVTVW